jgi:hypothetical protein
MTQTSAEVNASTPASPLSRGRAPLPAYTAITPQGLTAWVEERLQSVQQAIDRVSARAAG